MQHAELNTSSLADLIFSVLFFFILSTHMREADVKLDYEMPQATELTRLTNKAGLCHIYVGHSNGDVALQVNNQLTDMATVIPLIQSNMLGCPDETPFTVVLRADRRIPLSVIMSIKQQLRQAGALRICYAAEEGVKE